MSTRLERAQREYEAGNLPITKFLEIVITERNKEIAALQQRLRDTEHALEVCRAVTALCCERYRLPPALFKDAQLGAQLNEDGSVTPRRPASPTDINYSAKERP